MEEDTKIVLPTTRYQGSKQKIVEWIWSNIKNLKFDSFLDLFGGTGIVGYMAKIHGKKVVYNDYLKFNQLIGKALIENNFEKLSDKDLDLILTKKNIEYPRFIEENFKDIYFTEEENKWLDMVITNISKLENDYKKAIAFYCLYQSCIRKRPYNLFHRKNLYVRFANVKRGFGNKKTWDTPFEIQFKEFANEINRLIFNNKQENLSLNYDSLSFPAEKYNADLIYIDTPYYAKHSNMCIDYRDFYHFLEGMTLYQEWENKIDRKSKHLRLKKNKTDWEDKNKIYSAFDNLFNRFKDKIIVVSYRSGGIPSQEELINLLKKYKKNVRVIEQNHKYALSHNDNKELLFIAS